MTVINVAPIPLTGGYYRTQRGAGALGVSVCQAQAHERGQHRRAATPGLHYQGV